MDNGQMVKMMANALSRAREAVFFFERDGKIVFANEVALAETGYSDINGIEITQIYPMALHHGRNGVTWQEGSFMQTFAYRANKTCFPVKLYCEPVSEGDSGIYIAYGINDIERYNAVRSHRKAMEEVEVATKMKNEFTANITHELRTPINGIKGMAEGLMNTEMTPQQEETVGIILRCCDNMTKIINDILDFSKIEAGKIEIENVEFSLSKFLKEQLAFHSVKINEKGLKLVVNISGNVPDSIVGDELRLGQVLNNLFSNAIKFTSTGQVAIELTANELGKGEVELFFLIIDSGIGISDDEKDKLFKSFSQVDGSITRRFGGTGLGLAITKQLVTLMGGTISVDSEKGKGSTFSFTVKVRRGTKKDNGMDFPEGSFVFENKIPVAAGEDMNFNADSYASTGGNVLMAAPGLGLSAGNVEIADVPLFTDENPDETETEIKDNLEKLMICIELGSWEKAEEFATRIKCGIGDRDPELKRKAFSLLLNVRTEKYEQSMTLLKELGEKYGI